MLSIRRATLVALALALSVIMLGAAVRLSDAGLGCPDWPGCYGHAIVTGEAKEPAKAWMEMIHRYVAGTLGLLVFSLTWLSLRRGTPERVPLSAAAMLVVLQAALGMWTVTLRLQPLVVMGHLLGAMTIASLLWLAVLASSMPVTSRRSRALVTLSAGALIAVAIQVALGGWTSASYAALACPDFPTCLGRWWPDADFTSAFVPWRSLDTSFEHGVLGGPARVAIHVAHRCGALLVLLVVGALGATSIGSGNASLRRGGVALVALLAIQIALGISNVLFLLPLPVAVLHNGVATLLVLAVIRQLRVTASA